MTVPLAEPASGRLADGAGLVASVACAIHCAATPLVIGYLPMLGLCWLSDPAFHRVMAIMCFALALAAFLPGWKRHGRLAPALFGSAGVALLSVAAFGLEGECCPSCTADTELADAVASCADAGCAQCVAAPPEAERPEAEPPIVQASTPFDGAIPWITPAGGLLLIVGHVCNRRCACARGSCSIDPDPGGVGGAG